MSRRTGLVPIPPCHEKTGNLQRSGLVGLVEEWRSSPMGTPGPRTQDYYPRTHSQVYNWGLVAPTMGDSRELLCIIIIIIINDQSPMA